MPLSEERQSIYDSVATSLESGQSSIKRQVAQMVDTAGSMPPPPDLSAMSSRDAAVDGTVAKPDDSKTQTIIVQADKSWEIRSHIVLQQIMEDQQELIREITRLADTMGGLQFRQPPVSEVV